MALLTNYVLPVLAALLFIVCLVLIIQGFIARGGRSRAAYGFGQQEARTNAHITFWKAAGALLLAFIILGIWSLLSTIDFDSPEPTVEASEDLATVIATSSPTASATLVPVPTEPLATPTSPLPTATVTNTPTLTPTPSQTPQPSAVVNSPNGLYLRNAPGGPTELELIPNGGILVLLGEQQTADELEWVRVTTEAGNTGWVALDFIIVNQ